MKITLFTSISQRQQDDKKTTNSTIKTIKPQKDKL